MKRTLLPFFLIASLITSCSSEAQPLPKNTEAATIDSGDTPTEGEMSDAELEAMKNRIAEKMDTQDALKEQWRVAGNKAVEAIDLAIDGWEDSGCEIQDLIDGDESCAATFGVVKLMTVSAKIFWESYALPDGEFYISEIPSALREIVPGVTETLDLAAQGAKLADQNCDTVPEDCKLGVETALEYTKLVKEGVSTW